MFSVGMQASISAGRERKKTVAREVILARKSRSMIGSDSVRSNCLCLDFPLAYGNALYVR